MIKFAAPSHVCLADGQSQNHLPDDVAECLRLICESRRAMGHVDVVRLTYLCMLASWYCFGYIIRYSACLSWATTNVIPKGFA